jgi:glycosyltransferase involved in cell wall biosynthesis
MKVSVIVPTYRLGGLDVIVHSLVRQTHTDWELLVVDSIYRYRGGPQEKVILQLLGGNAFRFEPIGNRFPINSYCRMVNDGIDRAQGEIVLLLVDYMYLPPTCLERHVRLHTENPNSVIMGSHISRECPPLDPEFPIFRPNLDHYTSDGIEQYMDYLENYPEKFQISIWADPNNFILFPHKYGQLPEDPRFGHDPKIHFQPGECNHMLFYCRNESVRREHLLAINGFDEDLDGSHGYQDSDIADRLKTKLGLKFICDPSNVASLINVRPYFPHCKRLRPISEGEDSNQAVWKRKQAAGYPHVCGIAELP